MKFSFPKFFSSIFDQPRGKQHVPGLFGSGYGQQIPTQCPTNLTDMHWQNVLMKIATLEHQLAKAQHENMALRADVQKLREIRMKLLKVELGPGYEQRMESVVKELELL